MPSVMMNSGASLTRALRKVLEGLQHTDRFVYDILEHTKTCEEHINEVKDLFIWLKEANITARHSKCFVGTGKMEFIGHEVSSGMKRLHGDNVAMIKMHQDL